MKKNKRGISLAECVVAIAIITVITTTAVSVYTSAQSTTNREWQKFVSENIADDSISAFQSSENLNEFAKRRPTGMKALGDAADSDSTEKVVSIPFKTIRAYESGKINLFNSSLNIDNDSYQPMATFNYSGNSGKYTNDKQYLDNSNIYNKVEKSDTTSVLTTSFAFSQTKGTTYMSMGGERTDPNKATIDFSDGKVAITDNSGKKAEYEQTALEKYLVSKGQFLGFADNTNTGNTMNGTPIMYEAEYKYVNNVLTKTENGVFYFYVYELDYTKSPISAKKVKDGRNTKVIRVTFDNEPFANADKSSWNTEKYIHVTSVQWAWVPVDDFTGNNTLQAKYNDYFTDDAGNKFEDFNWYGFPLYAYFCNGSDDEGRTPEWELKGGITNTKTVPKLVYTDYTLKSGAAVTSLKIDYALYKTTETKLYTNENTTILFQYTGGDGKSVLTSLGLSKKGTQDGYDKYQKTVEVVSESKTGYYYYYPTDSSCGCFLKVTYSDSWNDERKIQAWVLKKSAIQKVINSSKPEDELPATADYSYRKG